MTNYHLVCVAANNWAFSEFKTFCPGFP